MASSASVDLDDDVQKMAIERQLRQSKDPQPVYLPQHIRGSVERAAAERASEDEAAAAEAPAEVAAPAPEAQAASPAGEEALALRTRSSVWVFGHRGRQRWQLLLLVRSCLLVACVGVPGCGGAETPAHEAAELAAEAAAPPGREAAGLFNMLPNSRSGCWWFCTQQYQVRPVQHLDFLHEHL